VVDDAFWQLISLGWHDVISSFILDPGISDSQVVRDGLVEVVIGCSEVVDPCKAFSVVMSG